MVLSESGETQPYPRLAATAADTAETARLRRRYLDHEIKQCRRPMTDRHRAPCDIAPVPGLAVLATQSVADNDKRD